MCLSRCSSLVKDWPQYVQKTIVGNERMRTRSQRSKNVNREAEQRSSLLVISPVRTKTGVRQDRKAAITREVTMDVISWD
jgi:hypothetical protein